MILPSIFPDELARGYLGRICRLNGGSSPEALRLSIERTVSADLESPWDCSWVELLAAISNMPPAAFFVRHTMLPFTRAVRPERECFRHGSRGDALEGRAHTFPIGRKDPHHYFCPACVAEDLAFWGTSYWRRSHQLRAVVRCDKHALGLHQVANSKWMRMPHDELANSTPLPASVIEDASQNPAITRYAEICFALVERDIPVTTNQMVRTIRHQLENISAKSNCQRSRISKLVIEKFQGPWQRHFFESLTAESGEQYAESFERTQSSINVGYATHFYALALATLFDTADEAIENISRPTVKAVLNKMPSVGWGIPNMQLAAASTKTALTAAAQAFLAGASIADACRAYGGDSNQLEALLRAAADPLRLELKQLH